MSIKEVIYDDICEYKGDKYSYGKYNGLKIVITNSDKYYDGYTNATKICTKYDIQYSKWEKNKKSQELIDRLAIQLKIDSAQLFFKIWPTTNNVKVSGTYVHQDLLLSITAWCDADLGLFAARIVNGYNIKLAIKKKNKLIYEQGKLLKKKDNKIDTLIMKVDNQTKEISKNSQKIDKQTVKINKLTLSNKHLEAKLLTSMHDQNKLVDEASDNNVIKTGKVRDYNRLVLIRNGDKYEIEDPEEYSVLRCQRGNINTGMNNVRKDYTDCEIVYEFDTPNAMMLWKLSKEDIHEIATIGSNGTSLTLREEYTEQDLINHIKSKDNLKKLPVKKSQKIIKKTLASCKKAKIESDSESDDESVNESGSESDSESEKIIKKPVKKIVTKQKKKATRKIIVTDSDSDSD